MSEAERLRSALKDISADIKPEMCASELELIVWWGRQVDRLQGIARDALAVKAERRKDAGKARVKYKRQLAPRLNGVVGTLPK